MQAKDTYQLFSESGSFGMPESTEVYFGNRKEAQDMLMEWRKEHSKVGSDPNDAYLLCWGGVIRDTCDQYPDFKVVYTEHDDTATWEAI